MSAILDALKKAQEERAGVVPGIARGFGGPPSPSRRIAYGAAVAVAVVVIAASVGIWSYRQNPRPAAPVAEPKADIAAKPAAPQALPATSLPDRNEPVRSRTALAAQGAERRGSDSGRESLPGNIRYRGGTGQTARYGEGAPAGGKTEDEEARQIRMAAEHRSREVRSEDMSVVLKRMDDTEITTMYNAALKEGDRGHLAEAKRLYLAILAERPVYLEALNNLGVVAMKEGNGKEALFYFMKALEVRKDYSKAYNNIGLVLLREGDRRQAEWNFKKAIETGKDSVEPYLNLSALYRGEKRHTEAALLLETLLNRGEKDPAVHLSYAILKEELGQPERAIPHYRYYLREVGSAGGTNPVVERLKTLETIYPPKDR